MGDGLPVVSFFVGVGRVLVALTFPYNESMVGTSAIFVWSSIPLKTSIIPSQGTFVKYQLTQICFTRHSHTTQS